MKTIAKLIILTLLLPPQIFEAKAEGESNSVQALSGVKGVLETVGSGMNALKYSQAQMQGMVNQFAVLQQQMGANGQALSQFDQVKIQLSQAMAESQQCVEKAKKDSSKFKKATIPFETLTSVSPTCKNYGNVIDSVKKNLLMMHEANSKIGCIRNLQNKINQIADSAKTPFGNLTKSANEVWNTRQGIIDTHQGIVDRLDKELNDEDNGYRKQLSKLKDLEVKIRNAISAGATKEKEGAAGIGQQLRNLKRARKGIGNQWYYAMMEEVQSCYASTGITQCGGIAASPAACVRNYLGAAPSGSAAQKAMASANLSRLETTFKLNVGDIKELDKMAGIDSSRPADFLAHTNKRFESMVSAVVNNFNRQDFRGTVNKSEISNFVRTEYRKCYDNAVANFKADFESEGGKYKGMQNQITDLELAVNNDIKNLIDEAQQSMTAFKTAFNKVYDRDLSQYSATCSASDSPYDSADCLQKLQLTLKGGIEGTTQSARLQNGQPVNYVPGETILNLQKLSLDQSGKATLASETTRCVGFDECINVLDRYKSHHSDQAESQKKQREGFVETHNKSVDTAMTGVAAQFSEVSKLVVAATQGITEDLKKAAVNASVSTTQVEGESLVANEKTGLYDMPKNMKAALAGVGSYSEIGETSEAVSSINARITELNTKAVEAFKMKGLCTIKKGDYEAIAGRLSCDEEKICLGNKAAQSIGALESVLRKGQDVATNDSKNEITNEYNSCIRGAKSSAKTSDLDEQEITIQGYSDPKARDNAQNLLAKRRSNRDLEAKDEASSCTNSAVTSLEALADDSRESVREQNNKIMSALRKMADSCPDSPEDAAEACEEAKKAASKAGPPEGEGETLEGTEAGEDGKFSDPLKSAK
jgi:hypothetical protein